MFYIEIPTQAGMDENQKGVTGWSSLSGPYEELSDAVIAAKKAAATKRALPYFPGRSASQPVRVIDDAGHVVAQMAADRSRPKPVRRHAAKTPEQIQAAKAEAKAEAKAAAAAEKKKKK